MDERTEPAASMGDHYREVFERAAIGIAVLDPEGRLLECNSALRAMLGRDAEELERRSLSELAHPDDLELHHHRFAELARGDRTQLGLEHRFLRKDGSVVWAHLTASLLEGDGTRVLAVMEDITDRKAAEETLEESQIQLFQAKKMEAVGRLAGGVAHDFNNMLTAIKGFSSLLRLELREEDPLTAYVDEIEKAAERSSSLTRQLLTFSRQQILQPRVFDLHEVIRDMERMLHRVIGEDARLRVELAPEPLCVRADPGQVEQVLVNLVANARDAIPGGGAVEVRTELRILANHHFPGEPQPVSGRYVVLSVADTGTGMDARTKAQIFEPFFTTKGKGKGTGLGLSTVYGIVRQSGGFLEVESAPGRGSTFRIYLPEEEGEAESASRETRAARGSTGGQTVLLVEDELLVRELARRILSRAGYRVLHTASGGDALLLCERHEGPIHLLITDVVMPEMSGAELADRLRALRPGLRVLYMSGFSTELVAQHGVIAPDVPFLQKPFTLDGFLARVEEVLGE